MSGVASDRAGGRGGEVTAGTVDASPSSDRDSADHAAGVLSPAASVGLPLLLYPHLRDVAACFGAQSLRPPAQCSGGFAGQCFPAEFQQDPGVARSAAVGGDQSRCHCGNPPSLSPVSNRWPTWMKLVPPLATRMALSHGKARLAVGHGDLRGDGVYAGPEPFYGRCDRAARPATI